MNNNNLETTQRTQRTKRLAAINALEKIKHLSQQHITKDKTNIDADESDSDDFYSDSDASDSDESDSDESDSDDFYSDSDESDSDYFYSDSDESNSDESDSDYFYSNSDESDSDESDSDNVKLKTKTKTKNIKQQHTVTTSASIININDIEDPNLFCPFCSTNYNKSVYKQLVCNACDYHACIKCIQDQWLPNNPKIDPCCPNCKTIWSRDYLIMNLNKSFIKKQLTKIFTKKYCDIDRAKLPETLENNIYDIKIKVSQAKFKNNSFDEKTKQKAQELKNNFYNIIEEADIFIKEYQNKCSELKTKLEKCINAFTSFEREQNEEEFYNLMISLNPNYTMQDIQNYFNNKHQCIIKITESDILESFNSKLNNLGNLELKIKSIIKSDNKLNYTFPINMAHTMRIESENMKNNNSQQNEYKMLTYGKKCSLDNCNGYLNVHNNYCVICENYTCSYCLTSIGKIDKSDELRNTLTKIKQIHVCNENDLKTVQLLKNDTKCCPKCDVPIFKANGCDVMWCTQCQSGFNWKSGDLITNHVNLHNPHYYQWLFSRNQNNDNNDNNDNCNMVTNNNKINVYKIKNMLFSKVSVGNKKKVSLDKLTYSNLELAVKRFDGTIINNYENVCRVIKIKYEECFANKLLTHKDDNEFLTHPYATSGMIMINKYQNLGNIFLFGNVIKLNNINKLHNMVTWIHNVNIVLYGHSFNYTITECEHIIRSTEESLNNNRIDLLSNTITEKQYTTKCYEINNNLLYSSELLEILKTTQTILKDMMYNLETQLTIVHNYFANVAMSTLSENIVKDTKQPYYIVRDGNLQYNMDYFIEKLIRDGKENYMDDLVKYLVYYNNVKYVDEINKNKETLEMMIDKTFDELIELINITNGLLFDMPNKYGKTSQIMALGHGGSMIKFKTKKEYLDFIENGFKVEYLLKNKYIIVNNAEKCKIYDSSVNLNYNNYFAYDDCKQLLGTNDIYKNVLEKMK